METVYSHFVQPQSVLKHPICNKERHAQIPLPADSDPTSNPYSQKFDIIETYISEIEAEIDLNATDSEVESLNYSDSEEITPWVGPPILTTHPTAGRSLRNIVQDE